MNRNAVRWIACLLALASILSILLIPASAVTGSDGLEYTVIVLDPGHGRNDNGASATYNGTEVMEKDLCWKIANFCKDYLEANYWNVKVYLTRAEGDNPSLKERVNYAQSVDADFLLSIHLNTFEDGTARGATAFVPAGTYHEEQAERSKAAADILLSNLEALGLKNRGQASKSLKITTYPNGGVADSYYLLRYAVLANIPAIIMEECFLSDSSDWENFLSTDAKLAALAEANAKALAQYFALEDISLKPQAVVTETESSVETSEAPAPSDAAVSEPSGDDSGINPVLVILLLFAAVWIGFQGLMYYRRQQEIQRRARQRSLRHAQQLRERQAAQRDYTRAVRNEMFQQETRSAPQSKTSQPQRRPGQNRNPKNSHQNTRQNSRRSNPGNYHRSG